MKEIRQPGAHSYVFSRYLEPIAHVKPDEIVAIYTRDCFEDRITKESDIPSQILGNYLNPQTGPIFIEGAEPGDTLAVEIIDIIPTRDWAVSAHLKNFGGLTATSTTRTLNEPLPEKVFIYKLENNELIH